MNLTIKKLEKEGFVITGRTSDAVYLSKGADHRVVTTDGRMMRGKPCHRGK